MAELCGRRISRLGVQLTLAFVGVAVAAVLAAISIAATTVSRDEHQILARQEQQETNAAASAAAAAYTPHGWEHALGPVIAAALGSGATVQVRDAGGAVVRSSPGFASFPPGIEHRAAVIAGGRRVGSVTMKFGHQGIAGLLATFNAERWRARILACACGLLLALIVALVVAPRITAPLDRMLRAVHARGSGQRDARVGPVRGFRDIRQVTAAFDQMADALGRQEQLRRNLEADIAHQLRTPVAVLQASTEAMLDGITTATPGQISSLHDEVLRLGRMVDDLERLAAAEAAALQLRQRPCS
jgi:two-component system, OmpR family, sensor histidine kinase BaeS